MYQKISFYNFELPEKMGIKDTLTLTRGNYYGVLNITPDGIGLEYFPVNNRNQVNFFNAKHGEYTVERKETVLKVFPISYKIYSLIIKSPSLTVNVYAIDGKYINSAASLTPDRDFVMTESLLNELEMNLYNAKKQSESAPVSAAAADSAMTQTDPIVNENVVSDTPEANSLAYTKVPSPEEPRPTQQESGGPVFSEADELLKFKKLLDMGVISQEEFDAKKKQILGL